jgi:hypothetical protein
MLIHEFQLQIGRKNFYLTWPAVHLSWSGHSRQAIDLPDAQQYNVFPLGIKEPEKGGQLNRPRRVSAMRFRYPLLDVDSTFNASS